MNAKISPALEHLARPLAELKPDQRNARQHPPNSIQAIAESILTHGQQKPIVVRKGIVIAGNGMYEAAKRLGWDKIAVVEFEGTDKEALRYALADNRTAELSQWDFGVLGAQIGLFEDQMELGYLWTQDELSALKTLNTASMADPVGLSPEQKKRIFESNTIKQIVIYLEDAQYKEVLLKFRKIAETLELPTNTEVILHLLEAYEKSRN